MVGPWELEPQTSTVSNWLYYGSGHLRLMSFSPCLIDEQGNSQTQR